MAFPPSGECLCGHSIGCLSGQISDPAEVLAFLLSLIKVLVKGWESHSVGCLGKGSPTGTLALMAACVLVICFM